jgi:thioredoxin reductase (NADPH)
LEVSGIFIAVGISPNTGSIEGMPSLDEAGYVVAGEDGVTDIPGVFAAGDCRTKPLRQVVTAVADGANAITAAEHYMYAK